jgi:hypothetical protein
MSQVMQPIDFKPIVIDHYIRYPEMQVEDLYKLAHQAAMGSEHAVSDFQSARQWLFNELKTLPLTSVEPSIDVITPDRSIARVHLKPYIKSGGDPENLLQAFIQTANEFHGSTDLLRSYWMDIKVLAQQGEIPFPDDSLKSFIDRMIAAKFPAVHHSAQYEQAYHPHYRVVAPRFLDAPAAIPGKFP